MERGYGPPDKPWLNPGRDRCKRNRPCLGGRCKYKLLGIISTRPQTKSVEIQKCGGDGQRHRLVAVNKAVILYQALHQRRGLKRQSVVVS